MLIASFYWNHILARYMQTRDLTLSDLTIPPADYVRLMAHRRKAFAASRRDLTFCLWQYSIVRRR